MKRHFIIAFLFSVSLLPVRAQVSVPEPEFIGSYCILTSDSTYAMLPRESGTIGKHQSKTGKWAKLIGGAANIASAAGVVGMGASGSLGGVVTGARVATTASGVASAAGTVSSLAGHEGMDIVFAGGSSSYQVDDVSQGVRLLIKGEDNEYDPMAMYRIVRFVKNKKDRRIQWLELEPSVLGTKKAQEAGFVYFTGHKYGEQSYLLEIPACELEEGEYGVFFMDIVPATSIPVGTFCVR